MRNPVNARQALLGGLLLATFASFEGSCSTKDSLIVVTAVTADENVTGLKTLVVSAGSTQQTFDVGEDVAYASPVVGLYVPSSLTGQNIVVTAKAVSKSGCAPGYSGTATVNIPSAGSTVDVTVVMNDATTCAPGSGSGGTSGKGGTSGTGGKGGTSGTGGSSGTGGTNCVEVDHEAAGTCASCTPGGAGDQAVFGLAFSPTNPQLVVTGSGADATGTQGSIKVWTVGSNGSLTAAGHQFSGTGLNVVAFSPDGSALAIGRTGKVDIMRVSDWTISSTVSNITGGGSVYGVGFSPDATLLIVLSVTGSTASTSVATLAVYPASAPQTPFTATIAEGYALGVSPVTVGGVLPVAVTTVNGYMEVFNLNATGFSSPATVAVTSTSTYVETAVFGPKGDVLAAGGDDGILNFWSLPVTAAKAPDASPIDIYTNTFSNEVWSAAFSPDEKYIAVGGGGFTDGGGFGSLTIWNASAPRAQASSEYDTPAGYDVVSVGYSPSGNLLVAGESDCGCVVVCPQ